MNQRYAAVDALRGLIMILMAIDHASAFIARQHATESWSGAMSAYTGAFPFLTRLVTHLCAPGFFFLMGAGIYWSGAGPRRTALRGLALLILAQILELPVMFIQSMLKPAAVQLNQISAPPPNDGTEVYWALITLSGLALVMIVCAGLLNWTPAAWAVVAAASVVVTNTLLPASGKAAGLWQGVLYLPGLWQHVFVVYPVIPWLGAAAAGMCFGWWWRQNPEAASRRVGWLGLGMVVAACLLRFGGGWGNIRPPRDGSWIEFLNNVKYPPSLVFLLLFIGVDLILLWVLQKAPEIVRAARSPLMVFGQAPLFFYFAHFYLLLLFGLVLFQEAGSLTASYGMWLVTLALLYPACAWYRRFKSTKPRESFWRLF